jgi:hypothetical protein
VISAKTGRRVRVGGYGSGRWARYDARDTVEACQRIDIRYIRKRGFLDALAFSLSWRRGREPSGDLWVNVDHAEDGRASALRLKYRYRRGYGEWHDVTDRIPVEWTPCNLGGERPWLTCPSCRRRRAVLCLGSSGVFRCRDCYALAYTSTRESVLDRTDRKLRKLRERMGDEDAWIGRADAWYYPDKPKGMHWRTWERLWREWRELITEWRILWGRDLAWMLASFGGGQEDWERLADLDAEAAAFGLLSPPRRPVG